MVQQGEYSFSVGIRDNPFGPQKVTVPVDWKKYKSLDFSGIDGEDGHPGTDGLDSLFEDKGDGNDGFDGSPGVKGSDGTDISLLVFYYDASGLEVGELYGPVMLLFFNIADNEFYLTTLNPVAIDVSGGHVALYYTDFNILEYLSFKTGGSNGGLAGSRGPSSVLDIFNFVQTVQGAAPVCPDRLRKCRWTRIAPGR